MIYYYKQIDLGGISMDLYEIFKTIMPAIITGVWTFLITKYKYNKNIPLDKLEISYNKVYYPIYELIKNESNNDNIDLIIYQIKYYLTYYNKYVDRSTLKIFRSLFNSKSNAKKKDCYKALKNNIYDRNSYLRRRLGYLEPNILQIYKNSSYSEKSTFRIVIEFCFIYIFVILSSITTDNIQNICSSIAAVTLLIFFLELIAKFVMFLYYKIRKYN